MYTTLFREQTKSDRIDVFVSKLSVDEISIYYSYDANHIKVHN